MKNSNKTKNKPKAKAIKDLAGQLEQDLNKTLPLAIQPDGSVVYKQYAVKKNKRDNWDLTYLSNSVVIDEYYLKSCALMSAKAYDKVDLNKFFEIKRLDTQYWASYSDTQVYQKNIKTAKEFARYMILLNKLEYSKERADRFQQQISTMFKWTFV
jgi:hypothetical protein